MFIVSEVLPTWAWLHLVQCLSSLVRRSKWLSICCRQSNLKSLTQTKRHGNFWWATLLGSLPDRWICQRKESGRPLWASTVCWKYYSKTVSVYMLGFGVGCLFFFLMRNSGQALGSDHDCFTQEFSLQWWTLFLRIWRVDCYEAFEMCTKGAAAEGQVFLPMCWVCTWPRQKLFDLE